MAEPPFMKLDMYSHMTCLSIESRSTTLYFNLAREVAKQKQQLI